MHYRKDPLATNSNTWDYRKATPKEDDPDGPPYLLLDAAYKHRPVTCLPTPRALGFSKHHHLWNCKVQPATPKDHPQQNRGDRKLHRLKRLQLSVGIVAPGSTPTASVHTRFSTLTATDAVSRMGPSKAVQIAMHNGAPRDHTAPKSRRNKKPLRGPKKTSRGLDRTPSTPDNLTH